MKGESCTLLISVLLIIPGFRPISSFFSEKVIVSRIYFKKPIIFNVNIKNNCGSE